jgi:hypothetical protein
MSFFPDVRFQTRLRYTLRASFERVPCEFM